MDSSSSNSSSSSNLSGSSDSSGHQRGAQQNQHVHQGVIGHKTDKPEAGIVVAIDGPVGSGKSTVAKLVAQRLGCRYVDSGAVYRAVAWLVDREKINFEDVNVVAATAREASIAFSDSGVLINGENIDSEIRSLHVAQLTSKISTIPGVRDAVNIKLRQLTEGGNVVMDGRDIGTVVLSDADVKVFLTASIEVRAQRRKKDLEATGGSGVKVSLEQLIKEIKERDERDTNRTVAPLRPAQDAIVIDTDKLSIEEVVRRIAALSEKDGTKAR